MIKQSQDNDDQWETTLSSPHLKFNKKRKNHLKNEHPDKINHFSFKMKVYKQKYITSFLEIEKKIENLNLAIIFILISLSLN